MQFEKNKYLALIMTEASWSQDGDTKASGPSVGAKFFGANEKSVFFPATELAGPNFGSLGCGYHRYGYSEWM